MAEEVVSKAMDEIKNANEDELKKVIEQHFEAVRTQGMKIGAQFISAAVMGAIEKNLKKSSKPSMNDYRRTVKRIIEIVSVQLTQQETVQNDLELEETNDDGTAE